MHRTHGRPSSRIRRPATGRRARARLTVAAVVVLASGLLVRSPLDLESQPASADALSCTTGRLFGTWGPDGEGDTSAPAIRRIDVGGSATVVEAAFDSLAGEGSSIDALALSPDGGDAWFVRTGGGADGAIEVYGYDFRTRTLSGPVALGAGDPAAVVAGALDPATSTYYVGVTTGSGLTLYAYNAATGSAIGNIGTVPTGPAVDGDLAVDAFGALYVLASTAGSAPTATLSRISGLTPTNAAGATVTRLTSLSGVSAPGATAAFDGMAFDNDGSLLVSLGGAGSSLLRVDAGTGAVLSGPTPLAAADDAAGAAGAVTDLADCAGTAPTLRVRQTLGGRVAADDQLTSTIAGEGVAADATATSTGSATGLQPEIAGPVLGVAGRTYTISTSSSGANLSSYTTSIACVDEAHSGAAVAATATGAAGEWTLTFPSAPGDGIVPAVTCTTSAALPPRISLSAALGSERSAPDDQIQVQIRSGSPAGPVVSAPDAATTAGTGAEVAEGTGTTGAFAAVPGTPYYLTQIAASGSLATYGTTVACQDVNGLQTGLPDGAAFAGSLAVTPVAGADIRCTLVSASTLLAPTDLGIAKTGPEAGGDGAEVTWTLVVTNLGPEASSGYVVTDAVPAGVTGAATTTPGCTVADGSLTCRGGALGAGASATITLTGSLPDPFTEPLTNTATVVGNEDDPDPANDTATHTIGLAPTLTLSTKLGAPRAEGDDQIQVAIHAGGADGEVVSPATHATTTGAGATVTPGSGTTGEVTAVAGEAYTLTARATAGSLSAYSSSLSCTDTNGVQDGLPDGAAFDGSATVTPTAGADISCLVTALAVPELPVCAASTIVGLSPASGSWRISTIDVTSGATSTVATVGLVGSDDALNALALTSTGQYAYAVGTDGSVGDGDTVRVYRIDTETGTRTTFTGATAIESDASEADGMEAGAIDPVTGIYYYATSVTGDHDWQLYAFDTTTVTNTGDVVLTDLVIEDDQVDAPPVCEATTLAPGASTTCTGSHVVTAADVVAGEVVNVAHATADDPDGDPVDSPPDEAVVPGPEAHSGLSLVKRAGITEITHVGQVIPYTFEVTNTGTTVIEDLVIEDDRVDAPPVCPVTTLAPGESTTCTGSHVVTAADLASGQVVNTAVAHGKPDCPEEEEPRSFAKGQAGTAADACEPTESGPSRVVTPVRPKPTVVEPPQQARGLTPPATLPRTGGPLLLLGLVGGALVAGGGGATALGRRRRGPGGRGR